MKEKISTIDTNSAFNSEASSVPTTSSTEDVEPITVNVNVSEATKAMFVAQGFDNVDWSDGD